VTARGAALLAIAFVCAAGSFASAQPGPHIPVARPRPARFDGVVRHVDYGAQTVTIEMNGRLVVVSVPRLHVEGSAVGRSVTASSIDIRR
jgi:hypothetical protein